MESHILYTHFTKRCLLKTDEVANNNKNDNI